MDRLILLTMALWPSFLGVAQTNAPVPPDSDLTTPYRVEIVASRRQAPWSVVFTPDQRIFFSERPGWVRVIQNFQVHEEPVLVLKDVASSVKMGLLGLAVDPGFQTNHYIYAAWNYDAGKEDYRLRIARFTERSNRFTDQFTLIEDIPAYRNHTGGRLTFGPDKCLYITTGDANQPPLSQRLNSPAGKILRINPDGSIPSDNPFAGRPDVVPAIWSYGHRNPQGLAFQPGTGRLFAPEHGPDHGDEINWIERGQNYGWPEIHHRQSRAGLRSPLLEFTPAVGPAAACFYTGDAFPELNGKLLVGCLRGEGILRIGFDGLTPVSSDRLLRYRFGRIREVTQGPDGFIYFTTSQNDPPEGTPRPDYDLILRLVPRSEPPSSLALATDWQKSPVKEPEFDPATTNATALITVFCAPCHGPGLRGGLQRGLLTGEMQFAKDDEGARQVITRGLAEKGMPAFGGALNPDQVEALFRYIRASRRN